MQAHHKGAFGVAFGIAIFTAILPPKLVGGSNGAFWQFVYDYQSLLSGALAVAAAYATIRQMRKSDELSLKKHQELLWASIYKDSFAVERFRRKLEPAIDRLISTLIQMDERDNALEEHAVDQQFKQYFRTACMQIDGLSGYLADSDTESAKPMFNLDVAESLSTVTTVCKIVLEELPSRDVIFSDRLFDHRASYRYDQKVTFGLLLEQLSNLKEALAHWRP